jgi:single-stranded-DNA-specific exonuclease
MQISRISPERIRASDIGFSLGPRLNAAGRLDTALDAYQLLVSDNLQEVGLLAQKLDAQNRQRQRITQDIQDKAMEIAYTDEDALLLFAAHPDFNPGVVGLAASKLMDSFYRPSIVAYIGDQFTRASCRSIPEFHITNALDQCADILVQHGGHAAAAGFTVENSLLVELQERLNLIAYNELSDLDLRPSLTADSVTSLSDMNPELLKYQNLLEPTGYGNPEPLYISRDVRVVDRRLVGNDGKHLKLQLSDGWITYDSIAFNMGYWFDILPDRIDLAYHYEVNHYNGIDRLQLRIKDLKPSGMDN